MDPVKDWEMVRLRRVELSHQSHLLIFVKLSLNKWDPKTMLCPMPMPIAFGWICHIDLGIIGIIGIEDMFRHYRKWNISSIAYQQSTETGD